MNKITISKNGTNIEIPQDGIYEIDGYSYTVSVDSENGKITVSRLCDNAIDTVIEDEKVSILKKSDEFANDDKRTLPKLDKYYKFIGNTFDWGEDGNSYGDGIYARYNLHSDCPKCIKSDDAKNIQFFDLVIDDYTKDEIVKRFSDVFNFHYETLMNENLEVGGVELYANNFRGYFAYYEQGYHYFKEMYGRDNHKHFTLNITDEFSGNLQGRLLDAVVKKENLTDFALYFKEPMSYFNPNRKKYDLPSTTHGLLDSLNQSSSNAKSIVVVSRNDISAGIQCILLSKYYAKSNTFHFKFENYGGGDYIDFIIDIKENRDATLKINAVDYYDTNKRPRYNYEMLYDVENICKAILLMNNDDDFENVSYTNEDGNEVNLELYYSKFLNENLILENKLMYPNKSNIDMIIKNVETPRSIASMLQSKNLFNGATITVNKEDIPYDADNGTVEISTYLSSSYDFISKEILDTMKNENVLITAGEIFDVSVLQFIHDNNITVAIRDRQGHEYKKYEYLKYLNDSEHFTTQEQTNIISSFPVKKISLNVCNYGTSQDGKVSGIVSGPVILNSAVEEYSGIIYGDGRSLKYHLSDDASYEDYYNAKENFINNTMLNSNNILEYGRYPEFLKNIKVLNGKDTSNGFLVEEKVNLEPFYKVFSGDGYDYKSNKLPTIKNKSTVDEDINDYTRYFYDVDKSYFYALNDAMVFLDENLKNFVSQLYSNSNIITILEKLETAYVFKISDIIVDNASGPDTSFYTGIIISDRDTIPDNITEYGEHGTNVISFTVDNLGSFSMSFDGTSYSFTSDIPNLQSIQTAKYITTYNADKNNNITLVSDDYQTNSFYREQEEISKVEYTFTKNGDGSIDITWNNNSTIDAKFFTINDKKVLIPIGGN